VETKKIEITRVTHEKAVVEVALQYKGIVLCDATDIANEQSIWKKTCVKTTGKELP
jgi:hypothetical protein